MATVFPRSHPQTTNWGKGGTTVKARFTTRVLRLMLTARTAELAVFAP